MNRLIERCAFLDVHKSAVIACVRVSDGDGGRRQEVREFGTMTAGLITLADWLRSWAVTVVGMESTGVYWRAIYYLLEDEFECQLFNARHLRHVPGRKSDVQDAEWAASSSSTASCAPASCRRGRSANCVTWSATARPPRSRNAPARSSASPPRTRQSNRRDRPQDPHRRPPRSQPGRRLPPTPRSVLLPPRHPNTERYRRRLIHQLQRLGHNVTLQPIPQAT